MELYVGLETNFGNRSSFPESLSYELNFFKMFCKCDMTSTFNVCHWLGKVFSCIFNYSFLNSISMIKFFVTIIAFCWIKWKTIYQFQKWHTHALNGSITTRHVSLGNCPWNFSAHQVLMEGDIGISAILHINVLCAMEPILVICSIIKEFF